MSLAYRFSTASYFFIIKIASIFNLKAKKMIEGRKKLLENLEKKIDKNANYIWIHCASLGEFEQGRPLIEKIYSDFIPNNPSYKILLSFFSSSGYEQQKNYPMADVITYLPFDTPVNVEKFIKIVNPAMAIFVKYEIWYYFLKELSKNNIPTYLISASFRINQIFFKSYVKHYREALSYFTEIFLQNEYSKEILANNNIENTCVCGDTRVDRVVELAKQEYNNELLEEFSKDVFTVVCGSTWLADEKILANFVNNIQIPLRIIIAPHEIDEKHLMQIEDLFPLQNVRLSQCEKINPNLKVIIVDSIGILSKIYRYADFAYIGGGFGLGIHNTLEAFVYKIPVVFGPNYSKFIEAVDLIDRGLAFSFDTCEHLNIIVNKLFDAKDDTILFEEKAQEYLDSASGATEIIYDKIFLKN